MAFPEIAPSLRTFTPGNYPHTAFESLLGHQRRMRHSNGMLASRLRISYSGLTSNQLASFIAHYEETLGGYQAFDLPNTTLIGATPADFTLTGYAWRYNAAPIIEDLPNGYYNVELELESVQPEGVVLAGRRFSISVSWAVNGAIGLAPGSASAPAATWAVFASISDSIPGDAPSALYDETVVTWAPGKQLGTADTSWAPGAATAANADAPAAAWSATASWAPGTATAQNGIYKGLIYTGNGSTQSITGAGFKPGFVWIKSRGGANHRIFDEVRGTTKYWQSITAQAEQTDANSLTSFDADGFSLGTTATVNGNGTNFVAWCIKEDGATSTNTDGSITTTVAVESNGAFSTFTYTGTGANATIGHGLGGAAEFVVLKRRDAAVVDYVGSASFSTNQYASWSNNALPATASSIIQSLGATTIAIGSSANVNGSTNTYVGHAFRSVAGISKLGTYTGAAGDVTVTTDFPVSFLIVKRISGAVGDWFVYDTARGETKRLSINSSAAESTVADVTLGSSDFVVKSGTNANISGATFQYIALR